MGMNMPRMFGAPLTRQPGDFAPDPTAAIEQLPNMPGMPPQIGQQPHEAGWADKAGRIGALLLAAGGSPAGPALMQQQMYDRQMSRDGNRQNLEFQRQLALARYKLENPEPTATVKNAQAAGLKPGTPEFSQFIRDASVPPHFVTVGSPETGQTIINASNPPPMATGGIDPAAAARLKANPSEAAMFDEHFGPGSAARILGGR